MELEKLRGPILPHLAVEVNVWVAPPERVHILMLVVWYADARILILPAAILAKCPTQRVWLGIVTPLPSSVGSLLNSSMASSTVRQVPLWSR